MRKESISTKQRLVSGGGPLAFAAALVASAGCGDATMVGDNDDDLAGIVTTRSALTTTDFTDGSGHVHTRVWTCDWTPSATGDRCAYCAVAPDWILIGGGAEIDSSPASARLQASFPYPGATAPATCTGNGGGNELTVWLARSKGTTAHRLRAYAVGLKIDGITASQIIAGNYMRVHERTSTISVQPFFDAEPLNSSLVVVGGGAELLAASGPVNGYLTELRPIEPPDSNLGWRGAGVFNPGSQGGIKVFSIGLNPCLPIPGGNCLDWKWRTVSTGPGSGYGTASSTTPFPWATAGVGARGVTATTSSRYLADMIPFSGSSQGFTVRTKDEGTTVSGSTKGYALNLMEGGPGLWTFNSIRFNTPGTAFSRPAGAAPVTLQQSNANPDAPERRWHLQSMGGGQYRIRLGNPATGTECACRISPSLNVRVTSCNTTSDCLWTADGGPPGAATFKLRNVANSRCIDNNGLGYTTSDLVFRTCVSGYSDNQSVFLDRYSWPP